AGSSAAYSCGERVTDLGGAARAGVTFGDVCTDGLFDRGRRLGQVQVPGEQGDGQDRCRRVGLALAGDVRGTAVHRLEHRGERAVRVHIAGGRESDAAGDRGGEVGKDVPEQ